MATRKRNKNGDNIRSTDTGRKSKKGSSANKKLKSSGFPKVAIGVLLVLILGGVYVYMFMDVRHLIDDISLRTAEILSLNKNTAQNKADKSTEQLSEDDEVIQNIRDQIQKAFEESHKGQNININIITPDDKLPESEKESSIKVEDVVIEQTPPEPDQTETQDRDAQEHIKHVLEKAVDDNQKTEDQTHETKEEARKTHKQEFEPELPNAEKQTFSASKNREETIIEEITIVPEETPEVAPDTNVEGKPELHSDEQPTEPKDSTPEVAPDTNVEGKPEPHSDGQPTEPKDSRMEQPSEPESIDDELNTPSEEVREEKDSEFEPPLNENVESENTEQYDNQKDGEVETEMDDKEMWADFTDQMLQEMNQNLEKDKSGDISENMDGISGESDHTQDQKDDVLKYQDAQSEEQTEQEVPQEGSDEIQMQAEPIEVNDVMQEKDDNKDVESKEVVSPEADTKLQEDTKSESKQGFAIADDPADIVDAIPDVREASSEEVPKEQTSELEPPLFEDTEPEGAVQTGNQEDADEKENAEMMASIEEMLMLQEKNQNLEKDKSGDQPENLDVSVTSEQSDPSKSRGDGESDAASQKGADNSADGNPDEKTSETMEDMFTDPEIWQDDIDGFYPREKSEEHDIQPPFPSEASTPEATEGQEIPPQSVPSEDAGESAFFSDSVLDEKAPETIVDISTEPETTQHKLDESRPSENPEESDTPSLGVPHTADEADVPVSDEDNMDTISDPTAPEEEDKTTTKTEKLGQENAPSDNDADIKI